VARRAVGRRSPGPLAATAASVAAMVGTGACSSGSSPAPAVDPRQIVTTLLTSLHRQRPSITIQAACPPGIPTKVGATFTCSVSLDGVSVSYQVQITGASASGVTIASRPSEPIIDTREVAAAVASKLAPQVAGATVTCGGARFLQLPVHGTFICTVSARGQSATLHATVQDAQGSVAFSGDGAGVAPAGSPATAAGTPGS